MLGRTIVWIASSPAFALRSAMLSREVAAYQNSCRSSGRPKVMRSDEKVHILVLRTLRMQLHITVE